MKAPVRILYISSEITPYIPESPSAIVGRYMPQAAQENGMEIRSFMPKYGCINERRNQLHEVIRLSGMNIVVNDVDRPLVIKVASIQQARIQVYFIENEDYFKRKFIFRDEKDKFFADSDERAILFAKGTLETVKKLRWQPTIVHCSGWIASLVPLYLKKTFKADPIFTDCKIIVSLYDEINKEKFSSSFAKKVLTGNLKPSDVELINTPNGINLAKLAVKYADGVIFGSKNVSKEVIDFAAKEKKPSLAYTEITEGNTAAYTSKYIKFYGKFLKE
ncbi:MAG: glycogen/starch synthase [Bacteroidales bacterium]|nr:glycogen/starch synthase [Bacteroidales bacterium]MBQ1885839.1 glycogen/starch synthase [Bacteroidales bacterium]MBR2135284.1 glycogen/starch synthase [Bacteroidales bacterium]